MAAAVGGGSGGRFLGTELLLGVPEARDEPQEIFRPSKQAVAAYSCLPDGLGSDLFSMLAFKWKN